MTVSIPKLTVIVRTDLGSGPRVAQAVHGARLFAAEHTQIEHEWYTGSNTIVILEAKDEAHLTELADKSIIESKVCVGESQFAPANDETQTR